MGNLASAHTAKTGQAGNPLTGATVGATGANDYHSSRTKLNARPANCRKDELARTVLGFHWVPTDLKVGVKFL